MIMLMSRAPDRHQGRAFDEIAKEVQAMLGDIDEKSRFRSQGLGFQVLILQNELLRGLGRGFLHLPDRAKNQ